MIPENILTVEDLSVDFDSDQIINDVSFSVEKGEALAIVGPNGAGKSTLFKALLGIIPFRGKVTWKKDLKIGYVPQQLAIERGIPLTVRDFLSFKTKVYERMVEALEKVGISTGPASEHHVEHHVLNSPMWRLSGGEFQRVLIAWALIDSPEVLLVDEPTAGIDIGGEQTIYNLLRDLQTKHQMTILLISHDLHIVYKYASKVICLNKRQICYGLPSEVLNPESLTKLYGKETSLYSHDHVNTKL